MESIAAFVPEVWGMLEYWDAFHHGTAASCGHLSGKMLVDRANAGELQLADLLELMRNTLGNVCRLDANADSRMRMAVWRSRMATVLWCSGIAVILGATGMYIYQYKHTLSRRDWVTLVLLTVVSLIPAAFLVMVGAQGVELHRARRDAWERVKGELQTSVACNAMSTLVNVLDLNVQKSLDDNDDESATISDAMKKTKDSLLGAAKRQTTEDMLQKIAAASVSIEKIVGSEFNAYWRLNDAMLMLRYCSSREVFVAERRARSQWFVGSQATLESAEKELVARVLAGARGGDPPSGTTAAGAAVSSILESTGDDLAAACCVQLWMHSDADLRQLSSSSATMALADKVIRGLGGTVTPSDAATVRRTVSKVQQVLRNSVLRPRASGMCDQHQLACLLSIISPATLQQIHEVLMQVATDVKIMKSKLQLGAQQGELAVKHRLERYKFWLWGGFCAGVLGIGYLAYITDWRVRQADNHAKLGWMVVCGFLVTVVGAKLLNRAISRHEYDKRQSRSNTDDIARASLLLSEMLQSSNDVTSMSKELLKHLTTLNQAFSNCNMFQMHIGAPPTIPAFDVIVFVSIIVACLAILLMCTMWLRPDALLRDIRSLSTLIRAPVRSRAVAQAAMMRVSAILSAADRRMDAMQELYKHHRYAAGITVVAILLFFIMTERDDYDAMLRSLYGVERSCAS